ncbi:unnamed protein product [Phytophthora fragariaefolia]|uniref:Unnamed protein product n=1 Tax=Phytophthora fragariaefolia TaxID=1490495 RepID=A0A9W7D6K0_9STRA|nr:unnamed protein product [Phytophthora fragariaefolia]
MPILYPQSCTHNDVAPVAWKTRVIATLDGKHLLGFVMNPNYDGLSDTEDDDVVMELPEADEVEFTSPDDSVNDDPPGPLRFPNKSELRRRETRAKMYLLSTLDNIHALLVRDKRTAYEIFATIRERYENKSLHGDPYYIQSYLMELKYEEGTDLNLFLLKMEQAIHACSGSTNSSLSDEQQSIYLYHAMSASWRNDLQIWKGTRKFIRYAELRHNIEQKVRDELAKTKYIVQKDESRVAPSSPKTSLPTSRIAVLQTLIHVAPTPIPIPKTASATTIIAVDTIATTTAVLDASGSLTILSSYSTALATLSPSIPRGLRSYSRPRLDRGPGCTRHITAVKDWFTSLTSSSRSITVGGKTEIPIEGTGSIRLVIEDAKGATRTVDLDNVLYAPNRKFNLLSVPNAARNDFKIVFDPTKCTLYYANRYKFFARLVSSADLYQFKAAPATSTSPKPAKAHLAATGKHDTFLLWHKRLGHPNFRLMQDMSKTKALADLHRAQDDNTYFCRSCVYAKSHRTPFNNAPVERAKAPLGKVHSDMTGPFPVPTLSGCHTFLTIIVDYSRYMYLYVIRNKSELYECYERFRQSAVTLFRKDIEHFEYRTNHFDPEIQVLQSDNAKEYEKLGRHISRAYGTHAQFTNAYTPQQNGVAERRMRTILERTRAFLIDGSLPQQLWTECVTHACNLINMTPSTATGNKTPYEKWYQRKPSSQYHKVFGCSAYAHIPSAHRNKLDPRAFRCMYVGLPRNKKGYRLMDIKTNKIVYCRDVVVKEDDFSTLACIAPAVVPPTNATTTGHGDFTLLPSLRSVVGSHLQQAHISTASSHLKRLADGNPANGLPSRTTKHANLSDTGPTHDYLNAPADLNEAEERLQHQYVLLALRHVAEPQTYREALRSDHASEWLHAAQAEYQSHIGNGT